MSCHTQLSQELSRDNRFKRRGLETRQAAVRELHKGAKAVDVCRKFKIGKRTLYLWRKRWREEGTIAPRPMTGRKRLLNDEQVGVLRRELADDPTITNERLAARLDNAVKPRTVSLYTQRLEITRKAISDEPKITWSDRFVEECREFRREIRDVPHDRRVYMDESFVYDNEARKRGRAPKGERIARSRERHGKRWTIYLAIRNDSLVHPPVLSTKNAADPEFLAYVRNTLASALRENDVVIWDRLGRAGRCKNPRKQHYNPEARAAIEGRGGRLLFLPPSGKYFNPIELTFGTLKERVRNTYASSAAAREGRPRTADELTHAVRDASLQLTPRVLAGHFRERADGRGYARLFPDVWQRIVNVD